MKYQTQTVELPLLVVKGSGPSLFGCNWLKRIQLNWRKIHFMRKDPFSRCHPAVFEESLGMLKGFKARIEVNPDAKPRYSKARTVPYALRDMVEKELD